jgi:hypothetical protein
VRLIESRRPVVDFPEVYLTSVKEYLAKSGDTKQRRTSRTVRRDLLRETR